MANTNESPMGVYPYKDNIKTPKQIGINDTGTMPQLGRNIKGLFEYVGLLTTGKSRASATGGPLGNKYFLKTGAKCQAVDTCKTNTSGISACEETDRYVYINNIPSGGLITGAIGNLKVLNPAAIFRAFKDSGTPQCQKITMEIVDNNNNKSKGSNYVTLGDIESMDPCWFNTSTYNKVNPITKQKCRESFQNPVGANASPVMSDDPIDQLYFAGLAGVGIYIFYRIMEKSH
jgi:hypothetical protein